MSDESGVRADAPAAITHGLAAFVVETSFGDLSEGARRHTREHVKDCLGVAIAAAGEDGGRTAIGMTRDLAGSGSCHVIASPVTANPWDAAWVNGTLAHLLDFDDNGFSHPTACILPAALAAAELTEAGGPDFVLAMALGYEVFERLSAAGRAHEFTAKKGGIHPTSVYGCPAAAAAAGRLLGLTANQMSVALGIASCSAGGLTEQFGTWAKGVHAGNAARAGVMAALLAARDYVGATSVLEGQHGLLNAFLGTGNYDLANVLDGLGSSWAIEDPGLSTKQFPACGSTQRGISAALELHQSLKCDPADIDRVDASGSESMFHSLHIDRPVRGFEGKFSLRFCLAVALVDGRVDIDSFTDQSLARPIVQELMSRVHIAVRSGHFVRGIERSRTPVAVRLKSGISADAVVDSYRGHVSNPMSSGEIRKKFVSCASRVIAPERVVRGNDLLDDLEATEISTLLRCVTG